MKRFLFLILCLFNLSLFAQENLLKFDKNFYEIENNWVVIPNEEGATDYTFGFVYLDIVAGYTFRDGGTFSINKDGKYIVTPVAEHEMLLYRLEENTVKMALIVEEKLKEMKLKKNPDWLNNYKYNENADNLTKKGYFLNHFGASTYAIGPLLKAYKLNPHEKGLEFELSYAYNATGEFQKAVEVLEKALKNNPKDHMFYRELGYSYINLKKPLEAEKIFKKGILVSSDDSQKAEMAYNMAGVYYQSKEKSKFEEWAKQVKKFAKPESQYAKNIALMENELK